jgi:hypothetical protein
LLAGPLPKRLLGTAQSKHAAQYTAMAPGTAAPRSARTTSDEGACRVHYSEEGKEADSFWGPTALGVVRNGGSLRYVAGNGGGSSVGGELDVRWFRAPATCTQGDGSVSDGGDRHCKETQW